MNSKNLSTVDSLWQVPLPLKEHTTNRVVVYFYNNGWIPITFYPLVDAIKLYREASSSGMDIAVFPPNLDPRTFDIPLTETHYSIVLQPKHIEANFVKAELQSL